MTQPSLTFHFCEDRVLAAPTCCGLVAVPDFLRQVDAWCTRAPGGELVVDLGSVERFDMSFFRCLVWARRRCLAAGSDLVLVLPRGEVLAAHEEDLVRELFTVAACVDDARSARGGRVRAFEAAAGGPGPHRS